ncbi:MAG: Uma2 family endonuclease [Kouleothrix sp.]
MTTTDTHIQQQLEYPESDGKPMGETDVHRREIAQIIEMLTIYFQSVADVYVSGNLMFYYEQGNPSAVVSPDVFVVKGVPKGLRRTYKLWEERQAPCAVFEISSRATRLEDKGNKRALYAMLGVREYFLFDPLAEYLKPPLQGFRLVGEEYVPIDQADDDALISQELGLRLSSAGSELRLVDIASDQPLLRPAELEAARQAEAAARQRAEQEIEQLHAEIARLKGEQP